MRHVRNVKGGCRILPLALALVVLVGPLPASAGFADGHCGAQGDWRSNLVPDVWPPKHMKRTGLLGRAGRHIKTVPVFKACIAHDKCYDTLGASRAECDRRFEADMRAECDRVYRDPLDLPQREACYAAAHAYYLAVAKNGGESFAKAQQRAKAAGGRPAKRAARSRAERPVKGRMGAPASKESKAAEQQTAPRIAWQKLGKVADAGGMAAMSGRIFLYKLGSDQLMVSRQHQLEWRPLGPLPPHQARGVFTAGVGRLFFWDSETGKLYTTTPGPIRWRCIGQTQGVACLAVGGNKLYALNNNGDIWVSLAHKINFELLGKAEGAASIAADGKTLYMLGREGRAIKQSPAASLDWRAVGKPEGPGLLSVCGRRLYMVNENGEFWAGRLRH